MSLFPKGDILTKEEIESWKSFVYSLSSIEDRELFNNMLTSERIKEFIIFMTSSKRRLCRPTIYLR